MTAALHPPPVLAPEDFAAALATNFYRNNRHAGISWLDAHMPTIAAGILNAAHDYLTDHYTVENWPVRLNDANNHLFNRLVARLQNLGFRPDQVSLQNGLPTVHWPLTHVRRSCALPVLRPDDTRIPLNDGFMPLFRRVRNYAVYAWDTSPQERPANIPLSSMADLCFWLQPRWKERRKRLNRLAGQHLGMVQQMFLAYAEAHPNAIGATIHLQLDDHLAALDKQGELAPHEFHAYCRTLANILSGTRRKRDTKFVGDYLAYGNPHYMLCVTPDVTLS